MAKCAHMARVPVRLIVQTSPAKPKVVPADVARIPPPIVPVVIHVPRRLIVQLCPVKPNRVTAVVVACTQTVVAIQCRAPVIMSVSCSDIQRVPTVVAQGQRVQPDLVRLIQHVPRRDIRHVIRQHIAVS